MVVSDTFDSQVVSDSDNPVVLDVVTHLSSNYLPLLVSPPPSQMINCDSNCTNAMLMAMAAKLIIDCLVWASSCPAGQLGLFSTSTSSFLLHLSTSTSVLPHLHLQKTQLHQTISPPHSTTTSSYPPPFPQPWKHILVPGGNLVLQPISMQMQMHPIATNKIFPTIFITLKINIPFSS